MNRMSTQYDVDADTLILVPSDEKQNTRIEPEKKVRSDPEKAALEVRLQGLPVSDMVPVMGLNFDHILEQSPASKLKRLLDTCEGCSIAADCQKNLKSCMRDADLIDLCPLWDADLV